MTERQRRVERLLKLRTSQHESTTVRLRAARAVLHETELALQQCSQWSQQARESLEQCSAQGNQQEWLIICADIEASKIVARARDTRRSAAAAEVELAAAQEADAKVARKQMERSLELIAKSARSHDVRAEQNELDETARLVSESSSTKHQNGRFP
ncbi:hypothetical protein Terro_1831 [Terriglobus roseus DSM 18391]|uniref:Flagellar FliJ protein n=1 Tax=Terriglobus roseus (strain DSM 18391 / NRRL B-41598 / KBS 63) TaxID=926566 RepID=I3ZFV5_TERRK|nr:hypothetical protein [Terriglobus roseus]AFL88123.1 hypothetical protein Terro_1831 [Terriglobus roseus DSM 18391]